MVLQVVTQLVFFLFFFFFCVCLPIQKHLRSDLIFALLSESNANWEWAGNQLATSEWASYRAARFGLERVADDVLFAKANWLTNQLTGRQESWAMATNTHHRISRCDCPLQWLNWLDILHTTWSAQLRPVVIVSNLLQFIKWECEFEFKFICQLVECEIKRFARLSLEWEDKIYEGIKSVAEHV